MRAVFWLPWGVQIGVALVLVFVFLFIIPAMLTMMVRASL